jgi:hypothetical protein
MSHAPAHRPTANHLIHITKVRTLSIFPSRNPHPGRVAPQTAFCFVLVGIALLFMSLSLLPRLRPFLLGLIGCVTLGLGGISVSGYLVGIQIIGWGVLIPMAVHTASALSAVL